MTTILFEEYYVRLPSPLAKITENAPLRQRGPQPHQKRQYGEESPKGLSPLDDVHQRVIETVIGQFAARFNIEKSQGTGLVPLDREVVSKIVGSHDLLPYEFQTEHPDSSVRVAVLKLKMLTSGKEER